MSENAINSDATQVGGTGRVMIDVENMDKFYGDFQALTNCLLYTSPSPRDRQKSRMPSSA